MIVRRGAECLLLLGVILFLAPRVALGAAVSFGHNVTQSTATLKKGEVSLGTQAFAVGVNKSLTLATSPWILGSYNTLNLHIKWAKPLNKETRAGIFLSYFQSLETDSFLFCSAGSACRAPGSGRPYTAENAAFYAGFNSPRRYEWQSLSIHGLGSRRVGSSLLHVNLIYNYFWIDDLAYSLRMDPGNDGIRGQVNVSALLETPFSNRRWRLGAEVGFLGINYLAPYLHLGGTIAYVHQSWLVRFGASYTLQVREIGNVQALHLARLDTRPHLSVKEGRYYYSRYLDAALHPEVQIQYFF